MLRELQDKFRTALLAGDENPLLAAIKADHIAPLDRFKVYQNNVFGSLLEVLGAAFPVTAKLAGFALMRRAVAKFVVLHPPSRPHLATYGDLFPDFLARFQPTQDQPLLSTMARLEWARNEALFAEDADSLAPAALGSVAPEKLASVKIKLHPSVRLLTLSFPVEALWHQCQGAEVPRERPAAASERLLVLRPAWSVQQCRLSPGDYAFLTALAEDVALGGAAEAALAAEPDVDLRSLLFSHLNRGTFAALTAEG